MTYYNMIVESDIKSLKEEQVKLKDESVESNNPYLPKLYTCAMFIGSKGSGNVYSLVSFLRHYEKSSILDIKGSKHTNVWSELSATGSLLCVSKAKNPGENLVHQCIRCSCCRCCTSWQSFLQNTWHHHWYRQPPPAAFASLPAVVSSSGNETVVRVIVLCANLLMPRLSLVCIALQSAQHRRRRGERCKRRPLHSVDLKMSHAHILSTLPMLKTQSHQMIKIIISFYHNQ